MRNNTKALFEKIFKVLQPPPDLKLSEWADEYRRLSSEASAEPEGGEHRKRRINGKSWTQLQI